MRVLMFGWEFPPHITGGLGTACFGLTKGLAKHDVDVIFVVPKVFGGEDQSAVRLVAAENVDLSQSYEELVEFWKHMKYLEISSNIIPYMSPEEYARLGTRSSQHNQSVTIGPFTTRLHFAGGYGPDLMAEVNRYAATASAIASNEHFDLIHAHDWPTYLAGVTAKAISGKPLVVHVHATEFDRSGENINQDVYNIERYGMENADRVVCVSHRTRSIVIERYGIAADKVVTVHNAVDFDEHEGSWERNLLPDQVVTFLGRVTFQKGPDYFVEAAYKVLQHCQNVRFVMAGSGDMLNRMIRRVAELGIADRFHFTGFLVGEEVDAMFARSNIYVMPSVSEPFGISPLEAMRSNVPVIISKQSGVAEILKYALKVDFWDIDALADCIYGLLHYKSLANFFKKYGQEEVNNLKWEDAALKVKQVYQSLT